MKKHFVILVSLITMAFALPAIAQQVKKPGEKAAQQPTQRQAIVSQTDGNYPAFKRTGLPIGAINNQWATKCKESDTINGVIYSPNNEIRIRARQLIGTVIVFPETVSAITSGLGKMITLDAYPNKKSGRSRIWILGAVNAGADGNIAFLGQEDYNGPRIYPIRVQTEGVNSVNCPDMVFYIKDAADPALKSVAGNILENLGGISPEIGAQKVPEVETVELNAANDGTQDNLAGTGRQKVDWLEGVKFDPSKLDFGWKLGGDEKAEFAPDIVYSDDQFLYLKWDQKRFDRMMMPAVRSVLVTDRGKLDTPVSKVMRGNVMVVQRVSNLTLTLEGVVVCVVREIDEDKGI